METTESPHDVRTTADRAQGALQARGVEMFARIDHGAGARASGLELGDEEVLVFGDPRVGTLLMQSDPAVGYELPLRLVFWHAGGRTLVGYQPPSELAKTYDVAERAAVLEGMGKLLEQVVAESVASD